MSKTKTFRVKTSPMWCENCRAHTISENTLHRLLKSGIEIVEEHCERCGSKQETEFFHGPTTRVINKNGLQERSEK